MRYTILNFFVAALFAFPFSASADVRINEIAWMGGNGNANCEWLELYNNSSETADIADWQIQINTTVKFISYTDPGEALIEPFGYFVIAREVASCADFFSAFADLHITSLSFVDTGFDLTLKESEDTEIDTFKKNAQNCTNLIDKNGNRDSHQ